MAVLASVLPVEESRRNRPLGEPGLLRIHHWLVTPSEAPATAFPQVDLAHWFFGCRPEHIHTLRREHYLHYHLGFKDGGMALIDIATHRPGKENYYSMHLIGSQGAAYADDHRNVHLQFGPGGTRAHLHPPNELLAVQAMLTEFTAGLREDRPWSVGINSDALGREEAPGFMQDQRTSTGHSSSAGQARHLPNAVAAHPRFRLMAVADDPDRPAWTHERNQLYADQHGIPYHRDVEAALADCDLVVVSPEAERHCDLALRAAKAGKHIVVDKPLSPSLADCDALAAAVEERGLKCLVWNRNFLPALVEARRAVEEGVLGTLQAIHCDFYFSKDAGPPKGSRGPGDPLSTGSHGKWTLTPTARTAEWESPWASSRSSIYPCLYPLLAQLPVARVFARGHPFPPGQRRQRGRRPRFVPQMADGSTGSLAIGRIGSSAHPDIGENKLHLLGSEGSLVVSEARPEVAVYARSQSSTEFKHRRVADENNYLLMQNFADALDHDADLILDARGARNIAAIVQASLASARSGTPVDITR